MTKEKLIEVLEQMERNNSGEYCDKYEPVKFKSAIPVDDEGFVTFFDVFEYDKDDNEIDEIKYDIAINLCPDTTFGKILNYEKYDIIDCWQQYAGNIGNQKSVSCKFKILEKEYGYEKSTTVCRHYVMYTLKPLLETLKIHGD